MQKVKNKKAVKTLAVRSLTAGKSRNVIAILAIALTSLLFTSVFTIGGCILQRIQEDTFRQVGTRAHAGYKYLTQKEYEKVGTDSKIHDLTYRITMASAENEELKELYTELSYYEDLDAKMNFCYPQEGRMPEKKYEAVASDLVLSALGVEKRIGAVLPLEFTVNGITYQQEFTLSGWYTGDRISMAQCVCLSKEYVAEIAPVPTETYQGDVLDVAGRINADFNFSSSFDIEGQMKALNDRLGFTDRSYGVNWAYSASNVDTETLVMLMVVLGLISLSGYLLIYNIFYISVFHDIRFYGLLKTIGITGKQIRKMVRYQAYLLAFVGIPLGFLGGYGVGAGLLPRVLKTLDLGRASTDQVALSPWIFVGSALFSFLTVYISCVRPCRIASGISPVEAVRFTEGQEQKTKGEKRTKKITMHGFALENMKRNKKKAGIVVLSLSLSLIILNSVFSLVSGFDLDSYISGNAISDYLIKDVSTDNVSVYLGDRLKDGITETFLEALDEQNGIKEKGRVYFSDFYAEYTEEGYARFEEKIWSRSEELLSFMLAQIGETGRENFEQQRKNRMVDAKAYGIDQMILKKLELKEGSLDWEKFSTGDYVITNQFMQLDNDQVRIPYYDVGETVTLTNPQGEEREYQVLAVAEMPYAASYQAKGAFDCTYILPPEEFFWYRGEKQPMKLLFDVEKGYEEEIEQWISAYCEQTEPNLTYTSRETYIKEFQSLVQMLRIVGGLLAFILALIGILNFINTMVTSIFSRKQELAMLQAVGMTGKQLQGMLVWEGVFYAVFTLAASLLFGSFLDVTVVRAIGSMWFYFQWNFRVLPIFICIPPLLLVVTLVPILSYRLMSRRSVVERIRTAE